MKNQVEYEFTAEPSAYRFLNTVSNWEHIDLTVKFGRSSCHVKVDYWVQSAGFDSTLSELDELASKEGGVEVS